MKTKIFLSAIFAITVMLQSNAQIKLLSNGSVSLAGTTVPAGYNINSNGYKLLYGGKNGYGSNSTIIFDFYASDPRIAATYGNKIVLYNTSTYTYNDLEVRTLSQYSDVNMKTNINSVTGSLASIKKLRGVTFNWKDNATGLDVSKKSAKLEYGLIAQEVEKILPDLVTTNDSTGGKMLAYTGLIPVLIEAIKELSIQVDDQSKQIASFKNGNSFKSANVTTDDNSASVTAMTLDQNFPNPFDQSTQIGYSITESTETATLYIYNMNGLQIKSISIQTKGKGSVTLNGSELQPGMYLYTLVADGKEVDTKRMILTE